MEDEGFNIGIGCFPKGPAFWMDIGNSCLHVYYRKKVVLICFEKVRIPLC